MPDQYLYLLLDLAAIAVPLLASFYPRAPFYRHWKYCWMALLLPAVIFIVWDVFFTAWGVWGFNEHYLTGIFLAGLPLEEYLFFLCIPYACLFTYFALNHLLPVKFLAVSGKPVALVLAALLAIIAMLFPDRWYTSVTFSGLALLLGFHVFYWKSNYLARFFFTFILILLPFFLINGILTGTGIPDEVVWYNNQRNLGLRMGTIPVEDTFYGMLLLLMNVTIYERTKSPRG